jgi:hypothetical protein
MVPHLYFSQEKAPSWSEKAPTLAGWKTFHAKAFKYVEAGGDVHPARCVAVDLRRVLELLFFDSAEPLNSMDTLPPMRWLAAMEGRILALHRAKRSTQGLTLKVNADGTPRFADFCIEATGLFANNPVSEKAKKKAIIKAVSGVYDHIAQALETESANKSVEGTLAMAVQKLQEMSNAAELLQAAQQCSQEEEDDNQPPAKKAKLMTIQKRTPKNKKLVTCYVCGKADHLARQCPKRAGGSKDKSKSKKPTAPSEAEETA